MARGDRTATSETGHGGREEHRRWLEQLTATQSLLNDARASESNETNRGQRRRKLNELKRAIVVLQRMLQDGDDDGDDNESGDDGGDDGGDGRGGVRGGWLSEHEKNRRRNVILSLLEERDVLVQRLAQAPGGPGYSGNAGDPGAKPVPRETEETATRTNAQLLQLQQALMEDQDEAFDHLERSVGRTKRIALGVYEETELQNRLLEDFDEEVGMTSDEVYNTRQRVRRYLAQRGLCGCCGGSGVGWLFLVVLMLMIVLVVVLRIVS